MSECEECNACLSGYYENCTNPQDVIMTDITKIHSGDRIATLRGIADQSKVTNEFIHIKIDCPCGRNGALYFFYRCFFCDIYFCKICAKDHFGISNHDLLLDMIGGDNKT